MTKHCFTSRFIHSGVDRAAKTIYGVSVASVGEAKGHNIFLDDTTLKQLKSCAETYRGGLKVKANHGSGVFSTMGLLKNFNLDGSQLRADFEVFGSSADMDKLFDMAEKIPDTFGFSVAFSGEDQAIGKKLFARCQEIYSADLVSEPAANPTGLFSVKTNEPGLSGVTMLLRQFAVNASAAALRQFGGPGSGPRPGESRGPYNTGGAKSEDQYPANSMVARMKKNQETKTQTANDASAHANDLTSKKAPLADQKAAHEAAGAAHESARNAYANTSKPEVAHREARDNHYEKVKGLTAKSNKEAALSQADKTSAEAFNASHAAQKAGSHEAHTTASKAHANAAALQPKGSDANKLHLEHAERHLNEAAAAKALAPAVEASQGAVNIAAAQSAKSPEALRASHLSAGAHAVTNTRASRQTIKEAHQDARDAHRKLAESTHDRFEANMHSQAAALHDGVIDSLH